MSVALRNPFTPRPTSAFSLIELLVVIAIIAVLIGMLMPALAAAREAARTVKCSANVRTVAMAMTSYSNDNRENFPHWSAWRTYHGDGSSNEDTQGPGWAELLEPNLGTMEAFTCAARVSDKLPVAYFLQSRYTASLTGGQFYRSLRWSQVQLTSMFVLTGDGTNVSLYAAPFGEPHLVPNVDPDDARWQAVFYAGEKRPHKGPAPAGGANIGFLDGHVSFEGADDRARMSWHGRKMQGWAETH